MTTGNALPLTSVERAVRSLPGHSWHTAGVPRVENISPGISPSQVFRVSIERSHGSALPESLILKIPDWGSETNLAPLDPWGSRREPAFFEGGLAGRLPVGLRTPAVLRIEERDGRTWIWMEDLGTCLVRVWRPAEVIEAARRSALLDLLYRQEVADLTRAEWLEREGYAAYAHHIPVAHQNLDRVRLHPAWSSIFSAGKVEQLHVCLDASIEALAELRAMDVTLVHGDFHTGNLGFDARGNLICLDWGHVGLAPRGSDIAILVSLYHTMGGEYDRPARELDQDVVAAYAREVGRLTGESSLMPQITRAFILWHLTWGLHIRLGPGLSYVLSSTPDATVEKTAADIRAGCQRALAYWYASPST